MDSSPHFVDDNFHPITVNEDDDMSISQSIAIKPAYDDEHAKLEQVMMAQGRTGSELKFAQI